MKAKILMSAMIFCVILFIDYILLVIIGSTASAVGADDSFYCTVFCNLAKILIVATTMLPFAIGAYKSMKKHNQ